MEHQEFFARIGIATCIFIAVFAVGFLVVKLSGLWNEYFRSNDAKSGCVTMTASVRLGGDPKDKLIEALDAYIKLLGEELDELMGWCRHRGFQSSRFYEGKRMREDIARCRKDVEECR